jgi:hypothetical protein
MDGDVNEAYVYVGKCMWYISMDMGGQMSTDGEEK